MSRRRRRAVYFHRPPVWCVNTYPDENGKRYYTPLDDPCEGGAKEQVDRSLRTQSECEKCKLTATAPAKPDVRWLSENIFQDGLRPSSYHQSKATLCTRLQSCKDIRVGIDEKWAIQEGSLVISIDPMYTNIDYDGRAADEFELAHGDFYVVCRIYADLWALCAKVSFCEQAESCPGILGFLPLCALTLAANFNAFVKRCSCYASTPNNELSYPGNGLSVTPPERSHSLNASRQLFQGNSPEITVPAMVYEAFNIFSLEGTGVDFVPLDSTLEPLLSEMGVGRGPLGRQLSLKRIWHNLRFSEPEASDKLQSPFTQSRFRRHSRRNRSSSSSTSQGLKWPARVSQEQPRRRRHHIRELISSGSERLRYHSRSNSTESDSWWR